MADLSMFEDKCFDLIINPVSNCFIPKLQPLWRETFRVLRHRGHLLCGFMNPAAYLFDYPEAATNGQLTVCNKLPYSDITSLSPDRLQEYLANRTPFEFSHTLNDQIGGQLAAGFIITGFYEDRFHPDVKDPLNEFMAPMLVTRAIKP
jgi:SAM-dependent methyltransferase